MTFPKFKYYGQLKHKTNVEIISVFHINHNYDDIVVDSQIINLILFLKQMYQDSIKKLKWETL